MVLDRIDPEKKYIHHRLFRDSCLPIYGNYIKDLSVLGRDIGKTIIIDNSMIAFALNIDNAIPIESFSGDKRDTELYKMIELINSSINTSYTIPITDVGEGIPETTQNLREILTSYFKLKERITFWKNHYLAQKQIQTPFSN